MSQWWTLLETLNPDLPAADPLMVLMALLLAFLLGQALAWTYMMTHSGMSYSRSFTQSLILVTILVALVMIVVGNNIVTAFGLLGALAIIRFRNVLKDTRDTVFIFSGLVVGLAVGSQRWATALVGTAMIIAVAFYLHLTGFGTRGRFDGFLRFRLEANEAAEGEVERILRRFCRQVLRVSTRRLGREPLADITYHIRLRNRALGDEMVREMESIPGIADVSLVLQEELSEV